MLVQSDSSTLRSLVSHIVFFETQKNQFVVRCICISQICLQYTILHRFKMSLTDILSPSDIAAALRDCQGEKTIKTLKIYYFV